jgi:hypothetical protein
VKVLAEVPDDQRFGLEADITRQLREKYPLLNVLDGQRAYRREPQAAQGRPRTSQGIAVSLMNVPRWAV